MIIKSIPVCEFTDILAFGEREKLGFWNEMHGWIYQNGRGVSRHWEQGSFIITQNFFNPEYQDDAYGLFWPEKLRNLIQKFMAANKFKRFVVLCGMNHCQLIL